MLSLITEFSLRLAYYCIPLALRSPLLFGLICRNPTACSSLRDKCQKVLTLLHWFIETLSWKGEIVNYFLSGKSDIFPKDLE